MGDRDAVDLVQRRSRFAERLAYDGRDQLEVPPRRDLRHDTAVLRMQVGLGGDDVRADVAVLRDHGGRRFVARGLYSEDHADRAWTATRQADASE